MALLREAHACLSNLDSRLDYDLTGAANMPSTSEKHAQETMFETMFGIGRDSKPKRERGVIGGALFVDERGSFFQRRHQNFDAMRQEITEGLPVETTTTDDAQCKMSTCLPNGTWDVRMVEVDADTATVRVLVGMDVNEEEADESSRMPKRMLRIERTFTLPTASDPSTAEVTLDEEGVLSVTAAFTEPLVSELVTSPSSVIDKPKPMHVKPLSEANYCVGASPGEAETGKKASRARTRRAKKPSSGLRAGFLNDRTTQHVKCEKQTAVARPMDVESMLENTVKERSNAGAAVDIDEAMREQPEALAPVMAA